uniref:Uncharacterized protein n=1 Tax=viral metagenome TaxID=1070528 RepID=A0A6M3JAB1_9ZZZZ
MANRDIVRLDTTISELEERITLIEKRNYILDMILGVYEESRRSVFPFSVSVETKSKTLENLALQIDKLADKTAESITLLAEAVGYEFKDESITKEPAKFVKIEKKK